MRVIQIEHQLDNRQLKFAYPKKLCILFHSGSDVCMTNMELFQFQKENSFSE